jgi:hypothetical protein
MAYSNTKRLTYNSANNGSYAFVLNSGSWLWTYCFPGAQQAGQKYTIQVTILMAYTGLQI